MKKSLCLVVMGLVCLFLGQAHDKFPSKINSKLSISFPPEAVVDHPLDAEHDAYIQNGSGYNQSIVRVEQGNREGFLQFDLSSVSGTITGVQLQFTINGDNGSGNVNIHKGSHSNWTESNLNNSTKPSAGVVLGTMTGTHGLGDLKVIELDVSHIAAEVLSLVILQTSGNDFAFASSEHATMGIRPKLIVTTSTDTGSGGGGSTSLYGTYELKNATTDATIRNLTTVNELTVLEASDMNINALGESSATKSVNFVLTGPNTNINHTESLAPFALFGDISGDFKSETLEEGVYSLQIKHFDAQGASGSLLATDNLTITVSSTGSGGGSSGGGSGSGNETMTLPPFGPIHDAYTYNDSGRNESIIRVEQGIREGYLQFDLSSVSGTITGVQLQFTINGDEGNGNVNIHKGSHSNWIETNLYGGTKPSAGSVLGSMTGTHAYGDLKTIDLDVSHIAAEVLSLVILQTSGNDFAFASSEHATTGIRPKLIVTTSTDTGSGGGGSTSLYGTYELKNATTDVTIRNLTDTNELTVLEASDMNINAIAPTSDVKSVIFAITGGVTLNRTEGTAPYALFGDVSGDFTSDTLEEGDYTLTVQYYDAASGSGALLGTDVLELSVGSSGGGSTDPVYSKLVFVFDNAGNQIMRKPEDNSATAKSTKSIKGDEDVEELLSETAKVPLDAIVSVEDYSLLEEDANFENSVVIYPNPTRGEVTLEWLEKYNQQIKNITIFDMSNRYIPVDHRSGAETARVDLTEYVTGVYIVNFYMSDGSVVQKKIIKK